MPTVSCDTQLFQCKTAGCCCTCGLLLFSSFCWWAAVAVHLQTGELHRVFGQLVNPLLSLTQQSWKKHLSTLLLCFHLTTETVCVPENKPHVLVCCRIRSEHTELWHHAGLLVPALCRPPGPRQQLGCLPGQCTGGGCGPEPAHSSRPSIPPAEELCSASSASSRLCLRPCAAQHPAADPARWVGMGRDVCRWRGLEGEKGVGWGVWGKVELGNEVNPFCSPNSFLNGQRTGE